MSPRTARSASPSTVTVFHLGPQDQDLRALAEILDQSDWQMCPGTSWNLAHTDVLPSSAVESQSRGVPIVLCEREGLSGSWKDVLEQANTFSVPPLVIVTSRTADEYLWAEALNLGAYDVLAKPYHPAEVVRVLSSAWLHGEHRPAGKLARAS